MIHGDASYTKGGNRRAPSKEVLSKWVDDALRNLSPDLIRKSFKQCGIGNALDGSEDDILFEDFCASRPADTPDMECDNYDDDVIVWDDSRIPIPSILTEESDDEDFLGFWTSTRIMTLYEWLWYCDTPIGDNDTGSLSA